MDYTYENYKYVHRYIRIARDIDRRGVKSMVDLVFPKKDILKYV